MPTSGTVAQTQINVATLIDTAFRRAGKAPSTVSGELLGAAQNALYFLCAEMVNRGINLFCVRKSILNVRPRVAAYTQSVGTTDILNALYRTLTEPIGVQAFGTDFISLSLDTPAYIQNVSGVFNQVGTTHLVLEYLTADNVWVKITDFGEMPVDVGADFAADIQRPVLAQYLRLRDISGSNIFPSAVRFRQIKDEINMAQLNRDDYANLPNKNGYNDLPSGGSNQRGLQFWHDKQITPVLYIWPTNNNADDQIVIYQHGQIEDVGELTNQLAVPPRWYECIIFTLAARLCLEIPPAELAPGRLEFINAQAAYYTEQAGRGESDGSSFRLMPRIGGYTR